MNLNAIKAVCSGGKRARIIRSMFGGQWISNGCAAYLVRGVVIDSPAALEELWNLSAKAREKAIVAVYEDLSGADALILPVSNAVADAISRSAGGMAAPAFHWPDAEEEAARAEEQAEAMMNEMEGEGEDG